MSSQADDERTPCSTPQDPAVLRERRNGRARLILADLHLHTTDADRDAVRQAHKDLYDEAGLPR